MKRNIRAIEGKKCEESLTITRSNNNQGFGAQLGGYLVFEEKT
jgi:hypothetical protein